MKATASQLTTFLAQMGLKNVEVVEDEAQSDFDQNGAIEAIDSERTKILRPRLEDEMKDQAWKDASGKYGGIMRQALAKATGMSVNALGKIQDDAEAIATAFGHYKGSLEGEQADVKRRLDEIIAENQKQQEALKTEYEGKLTVEKGIRTTRDMRDYIKAQVLKDAPLLPDVNKDLIAEDILEYYKKTFHTEWDEKDSKINFYEKDKPTMPALNNNLPVTPGDIARTFLADRGMWQKDTRHLNALNELGKEASGNPQFQSAPPNVNMGDDAISHANKQRQEYYTQAGYKQAG